MSMTRQKGSNHDEHAVDFPKHLKKKVEILC